MKAAIPAIMVLTALCSQVKAGDMPAPIWTGLYAGVHGGWSDWSLGRPDDPTSPTQKFDGGFGGAQLGYDIQSPHRIVLGIVADISVGDIKNEPVHDGANMLVNSETNAFGTIRGRLGYSLGSVMPYVTGGAAWMTGSTSEHCVAHPTGGHCVDTGQYDETGDFSRWGLAYGGGVEAKIVDHVSVFAEYLRLDFGTEKQDLGPKSWDRDEKIDGIDVIRAGVNYRF